MRMFYHSLLNIIFVETSDLGKKWLNKSVALIFSVCARLRNSRKVTFDPLRSLYIPCQILILGIKAVCA